VEQLLMEIALTAKAAHIRPTRKMKRVLLVLLTGAPGLSGYPICRAAGMWPGSVYPELARLEHAGWVASEWEDGPPLPNGGRRRFYRLTAYGRHAAFGVLGLTNPEGI
jgi:PadR family transcriptional regulator PadR